MEFFEAGSMIKERPISSLILGLLCGVFTTRIFSAEYKKSLENIPKNANNPKILFELKKGNSKNEIEKHRYEYNEVNLDNLNTLNHIISKNNMLIRKANCMILNKNYLPIRLSHNLI